MRFRRRSLRADLPFLCPVPGMTSFFDGRPRSHGGGSSAWEVLGGLPGSPGTRLGRWTIHRYGDRTAGGGRRRHHRPWRARGALPVVFPAGVRLIARRVGSALAEDSMKVRSKYGDSIEFASGPAAQALPPPAVSKQEPMPVRPGFGYTIHFMTGTAAEALLPVPKP